MRLESDIAKTSGEKPLFNVCVFFLRGKINNQSGRITGLSSARLSKEGVTGTGTLVSVIFKAKAGGETQLRLKNVQLGSTTGDVIPAGRDEVVIRIEGQQATGDVNRT